MTPEESRQMGKEFAELLAKSISRGEELKNVFSTNMRYLSAKLDMAMVMTDTGDETGLEALRLQCEHHINAVFDNFISACKFKREVKAKTEAMTRKLGEGR